MVTGKIRIPAKLSISQLGVMEMTEAHMLSTGKNSKGLFTGLFEEKNNVISEAF